jgi:hypothetical protein
VIYENSKDSAHFKNQQRKADRVALKIASMKKQIDHLRLQSRHQLILVIISIFNLPFASLLFELYNSCMITCDLIDREVATRRLSSQLAEMEARRDLSRTWIHVDMDMYAIILPHDGSN